MSGICQIVNNTNKVISYAALGYSSATPGQGNITEVLSVSGLSIGAASINKPFTSGGSGADYWAMVVTFEGDTNIYYLYNGNYAYANCDVPDGGAISFHILGSEDMSGCRADTFKNQNYTDLVVSYNENIATKQTILKKNTIANQALITYINSVLNS